MEISGHAPVLVFPRSWVAQVPLLRAVVVSKVRGPIRILARTLANRARYSRPGAHCSTTLNQQVSSRSQIRIRSALPSENFLSVQARLQRM